MYTVKETPALIVREGRYGLPGAHGLCDRTAAAGRGWQLTYFEQSDLFLRDGVAYGRGRPLQVFANPDKWFELGESRQMELGKFDCVFMRKDPPFDAEYIYTTYILEIGRAHV